MTLVRRTLPQVLQYVLHVLMVTMATVVHLVLHVQECPSDCDTCEENSTPGTAVCSACTDGYYGNSGASSTTCTGKYEELQKSACMFVNVMIFISNYCQSCQSC